MVETETLNKFSLGFLIFFMVVLFIANIIFSFKYSEYDFDNNEILSEIFNSLNGKLIYSLSIKSECSDDEEILTLGKWEGTTSGCICSKYEIYKYYCSDTKRRQGCNDIDSIPPKKFEIINSNYICLKKSKETYKELLDSKLIISKDSLCPTNYTTCGIIDTLGNKYCAKDKESCPINMDNINKTFGIETENEYESYPIGYDYILNNENNSQLLSIFKLGDKHICMNPAEKNWKYISELEPEDKICYTAIEGEKYDFRYEKISIINTTKSELYKDNRIPDYILANEDILYLYGRSFMGFEKGISLSYDSVISNQKLSNKCAYIMRLLSTILLIFISLPIICVILCLCGTGGHPPDIKCTEGECKCVCMTSGIGAGVTAVLAFLTDFILCIIVFACSVKYKIMFSIKSDDYSNYLIQLLIDEGSKNFKFSLVIVSIIFLALIPSFILLINLIRKGKLDC